MYIPFGHLYKEINSPYGILYAWFPVMHTRADILLCGNDSKEAMLQVVLRVYNELHRLEQLGNCYDPKSILSEVNCRAAYTPIVLTDELYDIIAECLDFHSKTLGCFDVTVHSEQYDARCIQAIELDPYYKSIFFRRPGVVINLSGYLKGYALDKIKNILRETGVASALVNLGNSSVLAIGDGPRREGWSIDFADYWHSRLSDDKRSPIILHDTCLTTSGNNSDMHRHIIVPATGLPVEGMRQIAVVTPDGVTGEILSTALFAATEEQCSRILHHPAFIIEKYYLL